jgi:peptidoglycan/LPS O-acetylase OafA/YrhL
MATDGTPPSPQPPRAGTVGQSVGFPVFPQLDGFRGLAVLLVLIEHTLRHSLGLSGPWDHLGGLGVLLFFALSGFLITGLLIAEKSTRGTVSLSSFYLRRAFRIWPAFFAFLGVVALLKLAGWVVGTRWLDLAESALFIRNFVGRDQLLAHIWSLSIEQQFYLFWPLFFVRCSFSTIERIGWSMLLLVVGWRTFAVLGGLYSADSHVLYLRSDFRFDALMGGSLLAWARHLQKAPFSPGPGWLGPLSPVAMLGALIFWTAWGKSLPGGALNYLTVALILTVLILAHLVKFPASLLGRACQAQPLRWLGKYSYSIYLWQQLLLVEKNPSWGFIRQFPVDLLLSVLAGVISYHAIEQPFLKLRAHFSKKRTRAD